MAIPTGIEDRKKCGGRTKEGGRPMGVPTGAGDHWKYGGGIGLADAQWASLRGAENHMRVRRLNWVGGGVMTPPYGVRALSVFYYLLSIVHFPLFITHCPFPIVHCPLSIVH